jgi:hypothetical protein
VLFPLVRAGHIPDILNSGIEDHENSGVLEFMNRLCALSRFNLQTPGNRFRTVSWIDCACSGGCFRPAWENIWYVILARNSIEFHRRRSCLSKGNFRVADKPTGTIRSDTKHFPLRAHRAIRNTRAVQFSR